MKTFYRGYEIKVIGCSYILKYNGTVVKDTTRAKKCFEVQAAKKAIDKMF